MDLQKLESVNPTLAQQVTTFVDSAPREAEMGLGRLESVAQRFDYLSPEAAYVMLDPAAFEQEVQRLYESGIPGWIIFRNVTSILPLLATWLTLFLASNAYTSYITAHAGQQEAQTSFFVLWQNGFDGRVYSFSVAAVIDVVLLALFLVLTVWVQRREEVAQTKSTAFARNLHIIATQLTGFIAEKGGIALPPGANVQTVAEAVNRATTQAIQASKQIADEARKYIDDTETRVKDLVSQLSQRLSDIQTQMNDLATATNSLGSSATTLSTGATSLANSAGQYIQAGQAIQQHLSTLNQTEAQLSQHLNTIGSSVSTAVNGFTGATQSVTTLVARLDQEIQQEVQTLTNLIDQASRQVVNAGGSLQGTEQALYTTAQELGRSGKIIESAAYQFEQALRIAGYNARSQRPGSFLDWMFQRGSKRRAQKVGRP